MKENKKFPQMHRIDYMSFLPVLKLSGIPWNMHTFEHQMHYFPGIVGGYSKCGIHAYA